MAHTSVRKGRIGELLVISNLLDKGYDVYTPAIDDNGVDLLVCNNGDFRKVQVKTHESPIKKRLCRIQTSIEVNTRRCYNVDVIAIPVKPKNCICYVKASQAKRAFTIAYLPSKNCQKKNRNWYEDYLEFPWD